MRSSYWIESDYLTSTSQVTNAKLCLPRASNASIGTPAYGSNDSSLQPCLHNKQDNSNVQEEKTLPQRQNHLSNQPHSPKANSPTQRALKWLSSHHPPASPSAAMAAVWPVLAKPTAARPSFLTTPAVPQALPVKVGTTTSAARPRPTAQTPWCRRLTVRTRHGPCTI